MPPQSGIFFDAIAATDAMLKTEIHGLVLLCNHDQKSF